MPNNTKSSQRKRKLKKKAGKCNFCRSTKDLTVDHKLARCLGGSSRKENLQVLCSSCNAAKSLEEQELYLKLLMLYAPQSYYELKVLGGHPQQKKLIEFTEDELRELIGKLNGAINKLVSKQKVSKLNKKIKMQDRVASVLATKQEAYVNL